MDVLKKLNNKEPFSQSELIIYNFVLEEQEGIENYTISKLSEELFVSKSTFVRFSKKLGYSGWDEFKKAYLKAISISRKEFSQFDYNFPFNSHDSNIDIANKLRIIKQGTIEETFSYLDPRIIKKAVDLISNQRAVHIFAEGYSRLASQDFCFRMTRIGKLVSNNNEEGLTYIAKSLQQEDLAIIISYSGTTESVLKATRILKKRNVPIITITSKDENPIEKLSSCAFFLPSKEDTYEKISNYATVDGMRYILDVIFSSYFNKNFNKNLIERVSIAKVEHIK